MCWSLLFVISISSSQLRKPKLCADIDESGASGQLEPVVSPPSDPEASPDGVLDASYEDEGSTSLSLSQR